MHIPDGFISPKVYIPAFLAAVPLWLVGVRRLKSRLKEESIPTLAVMTALAFVLMTVALPLPGGTSVHATGVAILAVTFGLWIGYVSISLVLVLQALIFGLGGVTSLPVNAFAVGFVGSAVAYAAHRMLKGVNERVAFFAAGWLSVTAPAALVAVALGVQPLIAKADDGSPLFFPFGLALTLPAVVIPHAVLGIGEGVLTVLVLEALRRIQPGGAK